MKQLYPLKVKNDFIFTPTSRDFIVDEIPLYEFSGSGEHLIVHIRKKDMTTWELISTLSKYLKIKKRDIGYAGLKDKNSMSMQYISILAKGNEEKLNSFKDDKIKILNIYRHNNKIKIGHLKGNRFKIRLKKIFGIQRDKLDSTLKWIEKNGIPNYFGSQRFGTDGNNWKEGRDILEGKRKIRDKRTKNFLINSYQSYLFNSWLSKRIELSLLLESFSEKEVEELLNLPRNSLKGLKRQPNFFKLLDGELIMHYPFGRLFRLESMDREVERFNKFDISPTGLLAGKRVTLADSIAGLIEENYNRDISQNGLRRYAWVKPLDIKSRYIEEKAHYELEFSLPKGSYATTLLDTLKGD